jgi:predicted transcriptional regulator of viral defense system
LRKPETRAPETSAAPASGSSANLSAQELLLESLRGQEVAIRDLQTVLDDYGLQVSPGNLSVILSRMHQSGLIERTGRGVYRASH